MILSDRDIRRRCAVLTKWGNIQQPMIYPFVDHKVVHNCGFSYGLSAASYDLRIAEDVVLPPNPVYDLTRRLREPNWALTHERELFVNRAVDWARMQAACIDPDACQSQLAYTLEYLSIPEDVCAFVVDKSSYARRFVSALNTLFDPGFRGHGVLELVNLSHQPILIRAGEPICQMVFHKMSSRAGKPYDGKYQNQTPGAHGARYETTDGRWSA